MIIKQLYLNYSAIIIIALVILVLTIISFGISQQTAMANSNSIIYSYDDAGRLTGVEYPNGATIVYEYDNAGNLEERAMTAGVWSGWIYDNNPKDLIISVTEFLQALSDYLKSSIVVSQLLEVLGLYL